MPAASVAVTCGTYAGRSGAEEFKLARIPGSQFFDIDGVADRSKPLPHMVPSEAAFSAAATALGIEPSDTLVFYDRLGTFSSPRAWWTWKIFGHDKCVPSPGGPAGGTIPLLPHTVAHAGVVAEAARRWHARPLCRSQSLDCSPIAAAVRRHAPRGAVAALHGSAGSQEGTSPCRRSPRLAWCTACPACRAAVMTGGFPAWKEAGGAVAEDAVGDDVIAAPAAAAAAATAMGAYPAKLDASVVKSMEEVKAALAAEAQVVDARSAGRFNGTAPEPRADLPSGHMPGACQCVLPLLRCGVPLRLKAAMLRRSD